MLAYFRGKSFSQYQPRWSLDWTHFLCVGARSVREIARETMPNSIYSTN